jgi:hypothetical protein
MHLLTKLANGLVMVGVASLGLVAGQTQVRPLVGSAFAAEVQTLENEAAANPSAESVRNLASAYLDRNEPGLASAALDRAPADQRDEPALGYVVARTLYAQGHVGKARAALEDVERACAQKSACPAWLVAKTSRQAAFLRALDEAGVEDPAAAPEAARAALERSRRSDRVVAIAMR